ncbi:hypothetical protein [Lentibacillus amyloliquefaciens]|nr:hypothetical protein [Lentibacillus amyloliquefaciens]
MPNYGDYDMIFAIIVAVSGLIGELALALWLLIKGVKVRHH